MTKASEPIIATIGPSNSILQTRSQSAFAWGHRPELGDDDCINFNLHLGVMGGKREMAINFSSVISIKPSAPPRTLRRKQIWSKPSGHPINYGRSKHDNDRKGNNWRQYFSDAPKRRYHDREANEKGRNANTTSPSFKKLSHKILCYPLPHQSCARLRIVPWTNCRTIFPSAASSPPRKCWPALFRRALCSLLRRR